jgi:hypothetical protein
VLGYVKGFFQNIPALAALVQPETIDGFEPTNGVDIQIVAMDFRTVRRNQMVPGLLPLFMGAESPAHATPNIHPSTCATARSGDVSVGLRNAPRVPSRLARESQRAML